MKRVMAALCLAGAVLLGSWLLSDSMPWFLRVGGTVIITKAFFQIERRVRRILRTKESLLEETERAAEGQRETKS